MANCKPISNFPRVKYILYLQTLRDFMKYILQEYPETVHRDCLPDLSRLGDLQYTLKIKWRLRIVIIIITDAVIIICIIIFISSSILSLSSVSL